MRKVLLALMLVSVVFACRSVGTVKSGVDYSKYQTVVINEFSLNGTAIQKNPDVKDFASALPPKFAAMVKENLEAMKAFNNIVLGSDMASVDKSSDYMVVEGSFTKITAGSTAARLLVGLGAGSSTVGAKWTVKDGKTGEELGSFEKKSHTLRVARGMTALESDARYLAKDFAKLMKRNFR